jgi:TatD DNase family protein
MPVRINTNGQGQLINRERYVIEELKQTGVDRISVSLNAHDQQTYNYVCKPKFENAFQQVLSFIECAAKVLDTEITVVTIPEVDISKIRQIAMAVSAKFRIRQYIPFFW